MNFTQRQIKPLAGFVLIKPAEEQSKTADGIYIPKSEHEKPQYGEVFAVGADINKDGEVLSAQVKVGQTVIYRQWSGDEIELVTGEHKLIRFTDLLAIIE